jgi:hypothetical protein
MLLVELVVQVGTLGGLASGLLITTGRGATIIVAVLFLDVTTGTLTLA